jgi:hypothetical protein
VANEVPFNVSVSCPNNTASVNDTISENHPFDKYWHLQKTVPFYLALIAFPLLNFRSPTFFTKFNVLGNNRYDDYYYISRYHIGDVSVGVYNIQTI